MRFKNGICSACQYSDSKNDGQIDWNQREDLLKELLDKHRKSDGSYDCIVSGSGGKDSSTVAHILKYKYNMNPLTVTYSPILYTDIGFSKFKSMDILRWF